MSTAPVAAGLCWRKRKMRARWLALPAWPWPLALLARAGAPGGTAEEKTRQILAGIEAGDPAVLELMRKHGVSSKDIAIARDRLATMDGGKEEREAERARQGCLRPRAYPAARRPGDLNETFVPLLRGEAFQEYSPRVLSTDPWIVYFEALLSEAEALALEANMFDHETQSFFQSVAGGSGFHQNRHSETAYCVGRCDEDSSIQGLRERVSRICRVPQENFESSQALRYSEGMYYKEHHDNSPHFLYLPCGARIYTLFVYLSGDDLEGGATSFPRLNLSVPAKRGAAVLFPNTLDSAPMRTDERTAHESEIVTRGEKRGVNMWLFQYDYRTPWRKGCTQVEFADRLGRIRKAAAEATQTVVFNNNLQKPVYIYLVPEWGRPEEYLGEAPPAGNFTVDSADGEVLHVYSRRSGGRLVSKRMVLSNSVQRVNLGRRGRSEL